jgi:mannosyltransferase
MTSRGMKAAFIAVLIAVAAGWMWAAGSAVEGKGFTTDEVWEFDNANVAFSTILSEWFVDTHSFYRLLYRLQLVAGDDPPDLRRLSLIAGAGSVIFIGLLIYEIWGGLAGLLAAGLLAISPLQMATGTEARMYSPFVMLTLASNYFLVRMLMGRSATWMYLYLAANILGIYTHLFGVFNLIFQNIFVIAIFRPVPAGTWRRWAVLQTCAAAAAIPLIAVMVSKASSGFGGWIGEFKGDPGAGDIVNLLRTYIFGYVTFSAEFLSRVPAFKWLVYISATAMLSFAGAALVGSFSRKSRGFPLLAGAFVFLYFAVPVALIFGASAFRKVHLLRYLAAWFPGLYAGAAIGLDRLRPRVVSALLALVIVAALLPHTAETARYEPENWHQIVREVRDNSSEGDLVIFYSNLTYRAFEYHELGSRVAAEKHSVQGLSAGGGDESFRKIAGASRVWVVNSMQWLEDPQGIIQARLESDFTLYGPPSPTKPELILFVRK